MWWLLLLIPAALLVFVLILLVRTIRFKPLPEQPVPIEEAAVDAAKAVEDLRQMVRCKTISSRDEAMVDETEFEKFRTLLQQLYPNVHQACSLEQIGRSGLLYHLQGKHAAAPCVFMAHYDVVPANEADWEKPPFAGILEDGVLWGRGTLDTKGTLCGVMEAAETLLAQGFRPEQDWYLAFSGDEEIAGETAPAIVAELEQRGVVPAMVIDEGGAVVEGVFPGVSQPCALIGIAEKGMLDIELKLESEGGHASSPPPHTPVGRLAQAVTEIENHPFRCQLTKPAAEMFDTLGRHSSFMYRMIFANLWCFLPILDRICKKSGGELNALMRTTCAFTMMEGSKASNVLPPSAMVGANLRLAGEDTMDRAIAYLQSVVSDDKISFHKVHGMNPSINSQTKGESWEKLKHAIAQTWPGSLISPYLMVACSDSRHYCKISNQVYRFSAMALSKEERGMIHGNNERVPVETIVKTAQFYLRLMRNC